MSTSTDQPEPTTLDYSGPPLVEVANPTPPRERAVTIDALRGVAILGILLLNVRSFALPSDAYLWPRVVPSSEADLWTFGLLNVLALGKFISIFAALYGVGILLATRRSGFGRFARRSVILASVGVAHMLLLWYGDILFMYAALGLVAYAMRNLQPRWMALAAAGCFGFLFLLTLAGGIFMIVAVSTGKMQPLEFTAGGPDAWAEAIRVYSAGYGLALRARLVEAPIFQTMALFLFGPQVLGLMLGGMALHKTGFFTGDWPTRRYVSLGSPALLIGLAATGAATAFTASAGWPIAWVLGWNQAIAGLLNPLAAFGLAALVVAGVSRGGGPISNALAAVGRMAFTNYLTQSAIGVVVFVLLGQYGQWGYFRQFLFVLAVWAVQIPFSVLWLSRFRYGPLEWLWRWATYGERPAMRSS